MPWTSLDEELITAHLLACRGDGAVAGHPVLATNINREDPHAG